MADKVSPQARSRMMSAVRGKNTAPELAVRRSLHQAGFRFRLHRRDLPGRPDIVLPGMRVAIFVNGCFWHGHDCPRGRRPATNTEFWSRKIEGNVRRDERNRAALIEAGWHPTIIWSCELEKGIDSLLRLLRRKRGYLSRELAR